MLRFAYVIVHARDGEPSAWTLTLNERALATFGSLTAALASARSLFDIDARSGADPSVEVAMPYGRFRVNWLEGDAVTLSNSPDSMPEAANSEGASAQASSKKS